jgi:D-glycero-D-manno-heptose 1,7-bisphosphate phosphatase
MKRPAVFFDRDNTLIVADGFLGDPATVVLVDGAPDAVARVRQYGFRVVTISNQSGVARGLFDEAAVIAVNQRLSELLQEANPAAVIDRHEFCPFHPDAVVERYKQDSFLRKPKPGMILAAAAELSLDLGRSWVVGDAPRDIEAGRAAGCRTVLLKDPGIAPSPAAAEATDATADFTVGSLREAIDLIARESLCKPPVKIPSAGAAAASPAPDPTTSQREEAMTDDTTGPSASTPVSAVPPPPPQSHPGLTELERRADQILLELRRRDERPPDFSVSKLLAGIVQVLSLAILFLAYLRRDDIANYQSTLVLAIYLQTFTIALLIMGKQR